MEPTKSHAATDATLVSAADNNPNTIKEDLENPRSPEAKSMSHTDEPQKSIEDDGKASASDADTASDMERDSNFVVDSPKGFWNRVWKPEEEEITFSVDSKASLHGRRASILSLESDLGTSSKPLKVWYRSMVIRQSCHSHLADKYISKDMYFNTASITITAITSSAIFTSLVPSTAAKAAQAGTYNSLAVTAGILAAFNTVLQAIMKTTAYHRRGENHLIAFKQYTKMRFQLENLIGDKMSYYHHSEIDDRMLDVWIEKYEELLESEPMIPQHILESITQREDDAGLKWTRQTIETE